MSWLIFIFTLGQLDFLDLVKDAIAAQHNEVVDGAVNAKVSHVNLLRPDSVVLEKNV